MKIAVNFLLLFCLQNSIAQTSNRQHLRESFLKALDNKLALDSLTKKLESIPTKSTTEECYLGICTGLYCQYDQSNWAKLKHVVKSKTHLNNAVDRDIKDPELRFFRLMLEHHLPSFLGFNKHIEEDLKVIFANPNFIDDNIPMKKKVIEFLLWSKRCSAEQSKILENKLQELSHGIPKKN